MDAVPCWMRHDRSFIVTLIIVINVFIIILLFIYKIIIIT